MENLNFYSYSGTQYREPNKESRHGELKIAPCVERYSYKESKNLIFVTKGKINALEYFGPKYVAKKANLAENGQFKGKTITKLDAKEFKEKFDVIKISCNGTVFCGKYRQVDAEAPFNIYRINGERKLLVLGTLYEDGRLNFVDYTDKQSRFDLKLLKFVVEEYLKNDKKEIMTFEVRKTREKYQEILDKINNKLNSSKEVA